VKVKIIFLCILIFKFLESTRKGKRIWNKWEEAKPFNSC